MQHGCWDCQVKVCMMKSNCEDIILLKDVNIAQWIGMAVDDMSHNLNTFRSNMILDSLNNG